MDAELEDTLTAANLAVAELHVAAWEGYDVHALLTLAYLIGFSDAQRPATD